jgi:ubiquinone/menaquinone biosynthesis C-methylase UbiE
MRAAASELVDHTHKSAVAEQFDTDSHGYLARYLTPENIRQHERIIALLERPEQYGRILDIGCGPGTMVEQILRISDRVSGVDISEKMIATAKERFCESPLGNRVDFRVGDAENLPYPSEHFDAVVCAGVVRYLPSLDAGLREIHRVLKPGGVMVVTFYYRFSPHWFSMCLLYRPLLPLISLARGRSMHECVLKYRAEPLPISYRVFRKRLSRVGFAHGATRHSGFDLFPFNRLFPALSRRLHLKAEPALMNADILGWLGSICIVSGSKSESGKDTCPKTSR